MTNSGTAMQFVTEADWIPNFWNYLLDLDRGDLIAELIQNDLDQGATRTIISFEEDQLVCEGNGARVVDEGWSRLRKIQGAGDSVPAKYGKIGVKNHGLKTAFTVGDELWLMSAGRKVVQTLYAKGRNKPPHPGASPEPIPDPRAPVDGCRIVVLYRKADIEPPHGEANVLGAISAQEIDDLFLSACAATPEQFAGIVSPEVAPSYEIVLQHWRFGEARFCFSCTRPRKIAKRIEIFRRRCTVSGSVSSLPKDLLEQAARRLEPLKGRLAQRVADFFRRGRRFYIEVSWPINRNGRPQTGTGRFRYPIGYPQDSHEARTGYGTNFNAPIVSDNKRHGPARNEKTNPELREACESLLVDVLARHTVPHWRSHGLNPLVPSPGAEDCDGTRRILSALVNQNAMPALKWRDATELLFKGKRHELNAVARRPAIRADFKKQRRYHLVIPVTTWEPNAVNPSLALLCPRSEMQLDPRTHPDIVSLLSDGKTSGFTETFVTFDERGVFDRATGKGNQYFDSVVDLSTEFAEPLIARSYLDLTRFALERNKFDADDEEKLLETLRVPDANNQPTPLRDIYSCVLLPSEVPGLRLPSVLHPDLITHALFRRQKWRRPKYTMAKFLESDKFQDAGENTRRKFWEWLRQNERRVSASERPKLAGLVIWPDVDEGLCRISDLCDPRSRHVGAVLSGFIRQPHEHVRRSRLVSVGGKAKTSIRCVPTENEIDCWFRTRIMKFNVGEVADVVTARKLNRFEADLAVLLKAPAIARMLKATGMKPLALARDGSIQVRATLVLPRRGNDRLALPGRFVLKKRQHADVLDKLSAALNAPTATMVLDAFSEDANNLDALHPRLKEILRITKPGDDERHRLADMPIIPVGSRLSAPSGLAFTGNRGDYWRDWKTRISGRGLSQDDQRRYCEAGVMSASPDPYTSRAFFQWLSDQDQAVLREHMPCVLRHILHQAGPVNWASGFTDIPFIPVEGRDGLRLVSLREAGRRPVYLNDGKDIGKDIGGDIIHKNQAVLLVIDHVKEVTEPISEPLRKLGVRSLREAIGEPTSVVGKGDVVSSCKVLDRLQPRQIRRTFRKRLDALGVESSLLRHDWQDRLGRINDVKCADKVTADYHFRGRRYPCAVVAGFDPETGIFWTRRDDGIGNSNLYETMAAQLIFKPSARPIDLLALERAVSLDVRDRSFGRPGRYRVGAKDEDVAKDDANGSKGSDHGDDVEDTGADPGEARSGHSPFEPDAARNTPNPGPIPSSSSGIQRRSSRRKGTRDKGSTEVISAQAQELEKRQIEDLKRKQYASHCQMCLCERHPRELAPTGSYIEWEEVRRRVVEAHHVDLKSAGGARHAGNLILLCKLHHDNFGRRLTREAIVSALQSKTRDKLILFGKDLDSDVKGQEIEVTISDTGEVVRLFFTDPHASYWRSQMRPPN